MFFSERETIVGFYPNTIIMASTVSTCLCIKTFDHKQGTHGYVVKIDLRIDHYVQTAFMDMYSRMRKLQILKTLFNNMKVRDIGFWNTMITGYIFIEHHVMIASTYYVVFGLYIQTPC